MLYMSIGSAHSLNVAVSYACSIQGVRNTMGIIKKVFAFLNTPKMQAEFIRDLNEEHTRKEKLKQLCSTK